MSWGNEVETRCPQFVPTKLYHEKVKDIDLIKDDSERYAIIIAASMQARAKMRQSFVCWYVRGQMMSGDNAFFKVKYSGHWPWTSRW